MYIKVYSLLKKYWSGILISFTIVNVILSASWLLIEEIHYDIDISRDFLVLNEAVVTKKPFLIGPHSGIIAGVFHGPLWYYLNLPAFILGHGNPVVIGWFWWLLSIGTILLLFYVAKKIFGMKTAILTVLLYSANSIINPLDSLKQFFNPYGAVVLSPLYYFLLLKYLKSKKIVYLVWALFTIGLIIQFQMAFGGPILFISSIYLLIFIYKNKLYKHILSYLILLIPLSTFIAFDLRHNFLQLRSLFTYFLQNKQNDISMWQFFITRTQSVFTDVYSMVIPSYIFVSWALSILFMAIILRYKLLNKLEYRLFIILYFGYWAFLYIFHGWTGNYYWPFLPIVIILLSSLVNVLPKMVFILIFTTLVVWNAYIGIVRISTYPKEITRRGINSWTYNKLLAEYIYKNADSDFGYYIFTLDRWVFNQKYALVYLQQFYPNTISYPSVKKPLTFLMVVDPPKDRPDIDPVGWRITDIGIARESVDKEKIDVTTIYQYHLSKTEISTPQNPNLLDSTFFR